MKRIIFCLSLCMAIATLGLAQSKSDARAKHSGEILTKSRKIDLLNQIIPILLTKKQMNAILGALEVVNAEVEKTEQVEFDTMAKLEGELDTTIQAGIEKNQVPPKAFTDKLARTFNALEIHRQLIMGNNIEKVRDVLNATLNSGQKAAAANAIDATYFDPSLKPADLTQKVKLDMYIRVVLLDPRTYSMLTEMFKHASN